MGTQKEIREFILILVCAIIFFFLASALISCTTQQKVVEEPAVPYVIQLNNSDKITLSWENTTQPHPERAPWSKALYEEVTAKFETLDKAQDITRYCHKYKTLSIDDKKMAWAEFFVALAYYESGYDEKNMSQDVGEEGSYSTYSVGLFQVSAVDIKNYGFKNTLPAYTWKELLTYGPNIKLALALIERQIKKQGKICVNKDVYFATLSCKMFAKYEVNDEIASRMQKRFKKCM